MKKAGILILFLFILQTGFAHTNFWGPTGHRTVGRIAQDHLTKKAKKEIEKLLDGQSLALVSTFADDIKSDSRFRKYSPWHYVNLAPGQTKYSEENAPENGDLLMALRKCKSVLTDKNASKEDKVFFLKMFIHLMGDLHQPLHTGRGEDKGGNDIQLRWFGQGSNLHRLWDSDMIEFYKMSYTELASNSPQLSKAQIKEIEKGDFESWMYESKALSEKVYDSVEVGEKLGYDYMYKWFPVVRQQLEKGGIRLAYELNQIFG